ncbi:MAG: hypothetical protein AB7I33_03675 [Gemmatimonadales bacterium]
MRRLLALALAGLLLQCSGGARSGVARDTMTTRERDSVIGASKLPGAAGVRGALRATDSAAARNARLDSVAQP